MAASTQNFQDYTDRAETIYEAVLVISQRARQLNQERVQKKREKEMFEESDIIEPILDAEQQEYVPKENIEKLEKTVIIAQREFLNDELEYAYDPDRKKKSL